MDKKEKIKQVELPNPVPVELAAKYLNVSPQYVRCAMRAGNLPIGTATKMKSNNKRYNYKIWRERLVAFKSAFDLGGIQ